jgi:hypothetical protein
VKRISISVLILCVCFVSVAWGQQPAATCSNNWSEFHRTNMKRWNPCEKVLNVNNVGNLLIALVVCSLVWFDCTGRGYQDLQTGRLFRDCRLQEAALS